VKVTQSQEELTTQLIQSAMPELLRRWQEGDREGHYFKKSWNCADIPASPHISAEFFQCQPRYLECFAKGEAGVSPFLTVSLGEKTYRIKLKRSQPGNKFSQWITRSEWGQPDLPLAGLLIELEVEGLGSWPVILEDTCRDSYLPERIYSYGARAEKDSRPLELEWDNFGRTIFIDKYLVSHADYELFSKIPADLKKLALPVTGLTAMEQEAYCASRGARRLEAHLWDAATMTPVDQSRPAPQFIVKPWLPWTRDRKGTFVEEALLNPDWKPKRSDCRRAFVHECKGKFLYRPYDSDNVSWMGIFHVLGGEPEMFRNTFEPSLVLKLSSRDLPAMAREHQLGMRGKLESRAGFRCYREVYP
jgi:hypothetical protein